MHIIQFIAGVVDTSGLPKAQADSAKITTVLDMVFGIVASMAVLIIVIAGFRVIAAHGDPNATAQARNTLLYAIIGLLVTMTAFAIVTFVVRGIG